MSGYDSDQPPDLVYSSDSDGEYDQPPEFSSHGPRWTRRLEQIVKIRTLAPFVLACSFGSQTWKQIMLDSGLLTDQWFKGDPSSIPTLLKRVELMEHFTDWVTNILRSEHKRRLAMNLLDNLLPVMIIKHVLPAASQHQLIEKIRGYLTKFPPDDDKDKVTLGVLYACYQYVEVLRELKYCDYVKQFDKVVEEDIKHVEEINENGDMKNDSEHYQRLVDLLSDALRQSQFSYKLYARRSKAYLKLAGSEWLAMMDAKRSIILNDKHLEGHCLYVLACLRLNNCERAVQALGQVREFHPADDGEVEQTLRKLSTELGICCALNSSISFHSELASPNEPQPFRAMTDDDDPMVMKMGGTNTRMRQRIRAESEPRTMTTKPRQSGSKDRRKKAKKKQDKIPVKDTSAKESKETKSSSSKGNYSVPQTLSKDEHRKKAIQGSRFLLNKDYRNAVVYYKQALNSVTGNCLQNDCLGVDNVLVIYACGVALKQLAAKKDLGEAAKKFKDIILVQQVSPMVHLALGEVYYLQSQFDKSEEMLQRGLMLCQAQKVKMWPGTEIVIEESERSNLKVALENMLISCRNLPPPVAKCCLPKQDGHLKVNIYIEDPEFRGYVRCLCFAKCVIEYHLDCWKKVTNELGRLFKKDLINCECLTPDCNAIIRSVTYYDMEGNEKRKIKSDKPERRPKQQHLSRLNKQAKCERNLKLWQKRKLVRKEKRRLGREELRNSRQNNEELQNEVTSGNNPTEGATSGSSHNIVEKLLPPSGDIEQYATVLKKNDVVEDETQVSHKKKKKSKKNLTFIEFVANQGEDVEDDDGYYGFDGFQEQLMLSQELFPATIQSSSWAKPAWQTSCPPANETTQYLRQNGSTVIGRSEQTVAPSSSRSSQTEEQTANQNTKDFIYSYFHNILEHHGPLKLTDPIIGEGLKEFPEEILRIVDESSGIGPFLSNNVQFEVVDDIVFLIQDRLRGLAMAQAQKKSLVEKYRLELAQTLQSPSSKHRKRKNKRDRGLADVDRHHGDYNFMDEECMSERSWPESEVSEVSKTSHPSMVNPPSTVGDVNAKHPAAFLPSAPSIQAAFHPVSPGTVQDVPKNAYSDFIVNDLKLPSTAFSGPVHHSSLPNHFTGSFQSGPGSQLKIDDIPGEYYPSAYFYGENWDVDDVDDDRSMCSSFSSVSKAARELDQIDDGLEISSISTDPLHNAMDSRLFQASKRFDEPITVSLSVPLTPKKKLPSRTKKTMPKSTVDTDKIRSKLLKLSRQENGIEYSAKPPPIRVAPNLPCGLSTSVPNGETRPSVVQTQWNVAGSLIGGNQATFNDDYHNSKSIMQPADTDSHSSRGSVQLETSTTISNNSHSCRERSMNTDCLSADWNQMEAMIRGLRAENAGLGADLERERQTRIDVTNEHSEQMDHLIAQLTIQNQITEDLNDQLKEEQQKHEAETTQLKSEIDYLKMRLMGVNDTVERNSACDAEDDHINQRSPTPKPQEEISKLELIRRENEKKLHEYAKIIKTCRDEDLPAPPEVLTSYKELKSFLQHLYRNNDATKIEHKKPIIKTKPEAKEVKVKPLQVVDLPLLPDNFQQWNLANSIQRHHNFGATSSILSGSPLGLGSIMKQHSKTSAFERLVLTIKDMFPGCQSSSIKQHILELRKLHGGTLSGMKLHDIIQQVSKSIASSEKNATFPRLGAHWPQVLAADSTIHSEEVFEEQDPCIICFEELTPQTELRNSCGHRFHSSCIREWLKRDSTCPTCRQHILLEDEFPTLH